MKKIILLFCCIALSICSLYSQQLSYKGVQLPCSWQHADSTLRSQGFEIYKEGHLTYVAGMIAYVALYKSAETWETVMINGSPDTKTLYLISGSFFDGSLENFMSVKEDFTNKYGKPYSSEVKESGSYTHCAAKWYLEYGEIDLSLFSYMKSYEGLEICKSEQPTGKPMYDEGNILRCY